MNIKTFQNSLFFSAFIIAFFGLVNCTNQGNSSTKKQIDQSELNMDLHTLSNYNILPIVHSHLNLKVDFDLKRLKGSVTHHLPDNRTVDVLVLDTKYLNVDSIQDQDANHLTYHFGDYDDLFGQPLSVQLKESTSKVKIFYNTTEKSEALDWLVPNQTAGKNYPFMYTQGQSIFTRSWIPIQDSPGLRITYSAEIEVPSNMMAVMSASNPQKIDSGNVYHFEMNQPLSPYLIALAVGNLAFKSIDHRTGVYAEPSMLAECAEELSDMGKMVNAAESLYGDYDWDRYDVIVLPPSFPFGGMENPRLTFATPTIIAGDKSLVALIAHELAHSWSGNLVTNATWNDFWLNEGFTVYFERRIMESLYGADYADMLALLGYQDLLAEINSIEPQMQSLKLQMKGRHPDDAMSDIAYEKGYFFLRMLENYVGRQAMDKFLKKYFHDHKFQTIVTEDFLTYLNENLIKTNEADLNINKWVYEPGLPNNCPKVVSSKFKNVENSVNNFIENDAAFIFSTTNNWSTHEWLHFIKHLPKDVNYSQLEDLDNSFGFSQSGNSEILAVWFLQSIKVDYRPAFEPLERFLTKIGRRKFLQPLYQELIKDESHKQWAKNVYQKARSNYHYVSFNTIDGILN
jgi:aminopeptidase N